jgi:uncharacterized protein YeaO (DUF488 family)
MAFRIKRIYEPATSVDGVRVLVDRLWPRGISKSQARLTLWLKEVAPSPRLRTWFAHEPAHFEEFSRRYRRELVGNEAVAELRRLGRGRPVTLLYGARDPKINHAAVLISLLRARRAGRPAARRAPSRG